MTEHQAAYNELYVYSMGRPGFILQHVADAFAVQTATADSKPTGVFFGLVGLYLRTERNFSGRQVQKAHQELARTKREWPRLVLPADRGAMTVLDVLVAPPGTERDLAIDAWCRSVWLAFTANHAMIKAVLQDCQII